MDEENLMGQKEVPSLKNVSVPDRVLKREKERIQALEEKYKATKNEIKESDGFGDVFNEHCEKIKSMIGEVNNEPSKDELNNKFADINKQIGHLTYTIVDSKIFLTSYDLNHYNKRLQELTEQTSALENKLLPRKKFGFKKIMKPSVHVADQGGDATPDAVDFVKEKYHVERDIGFYDRSNETLRLSADEVNKKPVSLSNIDSCVVEVLGVASVVTMTNIKNSRIYVGAASNSVFIENCANSTLYISCHQLRMHTSQHCNVYLHVTSRPIIEHCSQVGVAPNISIDKNLFATAGLDVDRNNWELVDDFNWLSVEEHSPNWFVIEESSRESFFP